MKRKRIAMIGLILCIGVGWNPPAQAQWAVIDVGAITQLIIQVQQLEARAAGRAAHPHAGAAGVFRDHGRPRDAIAPVGNQSQLPARHLGAAHGRTERRGRCLRRARE